MGRLAVILTCAMGVSGFVAAGFPTRVTPVNESEAIVAPFWDMSLRERSQWTAEAGRMSVSWCNVGYSGDGVFRMRRQASIDATGYDQLIASLSIPVGGTLCIRVQTERGELEQSWQGTKPRKAEYVMDLGTAGTLRDLVVEVRFPGGKAEGFLYFLGLRNQARLTTMLDAQRRFAAQPLDVFLAPPEVKPSFRPLGALFKDASLVERAQERHGQPENGGKLPATLADFHPEDLYRRTYNAANPWMFSRAYDETQRGVSLSGMVQRAVLERNEPLLRLAVRQGLLIALIPQWDVALSFFPDSAWEQRPFAQSGLCYDLAMLLEFGSDLLSPAGRNLISRRLAEQGVGAIQFAMWKYRYLQECNQFVVFSQGRLAGMLALEKQFSNDLLPAYTELAYEELCRVLNRLVFPDGGFAEGVGYFSYTMGCARPALAVYALARGRSLLEVAPASLRQVGNFGDVFISTDRRGGLINHSSSQSVGRGVSLSTAQFLAALSPNSQWTRLYHDLRSRQGDQPFTDLSMYGLETAIAQEIPPAPVLAQIPSMGVAASTRTVLGHPLKIVMLGGRANYKGHRHQDKGSFVIEFAGDTFACDPGGQVYAASDSEAMKGADRHNMLLPVDSGETWAADSSQGIRPQVQGDAKSFTGVIEPGSVWPRSMVSWVRKLESPTGERIRLEDRYQLKAGRGVRQIWMTELPVKRLSDHSLELQGQEAVMTIRWQEGVEFSTETLLIRGKEPYSRLSWLKEGTAGTMVLDMTLQLKNAAP